MRFFRFKVLYYDQLEEWKATDTGFVCGENYAEAAGKIEKWYSTDLIAIELLYETDNDIVLLDNTIKETLKAEMKD